jgi:membrane protein YdbS with pleckstrin-like domain
MADGSDDTVGDTDEESPSRQDEAMRHTRNSPPDDGGESTPPDSAHVDSPGHHKEGSTAGTAPDLLEYTTDRRSLASQVQLQWGISALISVIILSILTTLALNALNLDPRFGALALIVYFLLSSIWVTLRYRRWVYRVREESLYLERGVVTHVRTVVPYVRIQHVDTSRGPIERLLGLSTLVVYTAGSRGADVSIPGLTPDEARDLQQRVKELAIEAEGGDAL